MNELRDGEVDTLTVTDIGPVRHLEMKMPKSGGILVLRGKNGSGKSMVLEAAGKLLGGKGKPTPTDGAARGKIEGFGAKLTVGSRLTSSGNLEVESLESKLDIGVLIDPGIADPVAADKRRTKALISLLGTIPDQARFRSLVGGADAWVALGVTPTDDLVELSGRTKRALESRARDLEKSALKLRAKAEAMAVGAGEAEDVETDSQVLGAALEAAIAENAGLRARQQNALDHDDRRHGAQVWLKELELDDVPKAEIDLHDAAQVVHRDKQEIDDLEGKLEAVRCRLQSNESVAALAEGRLESQRALRDQRLAYLEVLNADCNPHPTKEDLDQALIEVESARLALEEGAQARAANAKRDEAKSILEEARELRKDGEGLRDKAAATDEILTEAVAELEIGLEVVGGRLCTSTDRGKTPFSELSHGERVKLALDLGVKRVGKGGVLALSQESFESLDPDNKRLLAVGARRRGVVVLTAQADLGDLRSEVYDMSNDELAG